MVKTTYISTEDTIKKLQNFKKKNETKILQNYK